MDRQTKKSLKKSIEEEVKAFYQKLDHPLMEVVAVLRKIVLETDSAIAEQIKWNSPGFFYTGEMRAFNPKEYKRDLVVFNLHKKDRVLLVFPTGAKIDPAPGVLEGDYTDGRRLITIKSMEDVTGKKNALQAVIRDWLHMIDK